MKKHTMSALLLSVLSAFSFHAISCTFKISQYSNTNDLIRDEKFREHIKDFFW